jgi:hypothetical protein
MTRPSTDSTTYAVDDVISSSTSAGTFMTFSNVGSENGQSCNIVGAKITCTVKQSLLPSVELWLFSATPTAENDNANFTITDAENDTVVAVIPFTGTWMYSALNSRYDLNSINYPIVLGASTTHLYGILVVKNAYVPVSSTPGESFTVTLKVERQ